jgi:hypothetical protein
MTKVSGRPDTVKRPDASNAPGRLFDTLTTFAAELRAVSLEAFIRLPRQRQKALRRPRFHPVRSRTKMRGPVSRPAL